MKTRLLILIFFSISVIPLIYAEESSTFEIDGYDIITNSPNVSAIDIDWDSKYLPELSVNFTEQYTGQFQIQIPKNMPRTMNLDFETTLMMDVGSLSGADQEKDWNEHITEKDFKTIDDRVSETESLCHYIITVELSKVDYFKIVTGSVASGRWEPVTIRNEKCDDVSGGTTFQNGSVFPRHGFHLSNLPPLKQFKSGISPDKIECKESLVLVTRHDGSPACVSPETLAKLVERGWVIKDFGNADAEPAISSGLQVDVTGQQQIRRGTTHDIAVDVTRDGYSVSDALVRIKIEDYGKNVIRDFKGRTDDSGRFVFSWEIPKSFDDIKTLLAYVDVTDDISAKNDSLQVPSLLPSWRNWMQG